VPGRVLEGLTILRTRYSKTLGLTGFALLLLVGSGCLPNSGKRREGKSAAGKSQAAKALPPPSQVLELDEEIEFTFGPKPGCLMGDMDTISKELSRKGSQRLLFSIEPVLAQDTRFRPLVKQVDPGEAVSSGTTVQFKLPKVQKPVHLGLFVCKDNQDEGRCATKKPYNLVKMTSILFFKGPARAEKLVQADKPYYFQYILYDGKRLRFMSSAVDSEHAFHRWAHELQKELAASGERRYHQDALARVGQLQRMLTSRPLEVRKGRKRTALTALLPLLDRDRCMPGDERSQPYEPKLSGPTPGYSRPKAKSALPRIPTADDVNSVR
jgi:hypothetical protein